MGGREGRVREGRREQGSNTNAEQTSDLCHVTLTWPSPQGVINTSSCR